MTQQRGVNTSIKIGFENVAYGTVADTGFIMPFNSCGVVGQKARNTPATIRGRRDPAAPFSGNQNVNGPIVVPADSVAMIYWLMAMFGNPSSSGAGPYVHEFKIGSSMPSFSLEKAFTDLATDVYERFVGCKISTFSMTVGGDGELIANMGVLGSKMTEETTPFDAAPIVPSLARVQNFNAALLEGGSSLSNSTEFSINLDFGLDPNSFVIGGGGIRGDIPEGIVAVTGNLKTLFEDKSLLDKAIADTETSLKVTITASASSVMEFEIQELLYSVNGVPVDGPQGLIVSLDFAGYWTNGAEGSAMVARATNGVASYAMAASHSVSASVSPSISASASPS
jgi:tail tube protein